MGVETELFGIKNRGDGKEFRVVEKADGSIAVYAGDVALIEPGKIPVTATPSAQGVGNIQQGGKLISIPFRGKGPVVIRPAGTIAQSGSGDITRHMTAALKSSSIVSARVGIKHDYAAVTGIKAALAFTANVNSLITPTGSWVTATFNDATSVNVGAPAAGTGLTAIVEAFVLSDIMSIQSLPVDAGITATGMPVGSILMARSYQPVGQQLTRNDFTGSPTFSAGGLFCAFQTGVDGVTTPAGFTSTTGQGNTPPFEIWLYSADDQRSFGAWGGSTNAGYGDNSGRSRGWAFEACNGIVEGNVTHFNGGCASQQTRYSLARAITDMQRIRPHAAAYSPFSTNDPAVGTAAGDAAVVAAIEEWIFQCNVAGVVPALVTFQYPTGYSAAIIASRSAANARIRAVCDEGRAIKIDVDAALCTETGWISATYTDDGLHPNGVGVAVAGAYVRPAVQYAVGL